MIFRAFRQQDPEEQENTHSRNQPPSGYVTEGSWLRSDGGGAQGRAGGLYRELPERLSA